MNKISKKIVSLVTMAAFALTLVPAAAFAADVNGRSVTIDGATNGAVEIVAGDVVTVDVAVGTTAIDKDTNDQMAIIVTDKDGDNVTAEANFPNADADNGDNNTFVSGADWGPAYWVRSAAANITEEVEITFPAAGVYTVKAVKYTTGTFDATKATTVGTVTVYDRATVAGYSYYGVMDNSQIQKTAEVAVDTDLTTEFRIGDTHYDGIDGVDFGPVYVWATPADKDEPVVTMTSVENGTLGADNKGGYVVQNVKNGTQVDVQFGAAGTYDLHAGFGATLAEAQKAELLGTTTVTVTDDVVADSLTLTKVNVAGKDYTFAAKDYNESTNTYTLDLTDKTFKYNGIDEITLTGLLEESDGTPAKYQTINFSTTRTDVVEFAKDSAKTENNGIFNAVFTMQDQKNAIITLTDKETGLECNVRVIAAKTAAQDINRTLTGGYVLAGTDTDNWTYLNRMFTDAVQFEILDDKGDAVTGPVDATIDVRVQPNAGKSNALDGNDFRLVDSGNGVYTLWYKGDQAKLVPGKYEVRVAIASEDNATVTFTAAKFGKAQDTVLDVYASDHNWTDGNPNEDVMTVDDQITLGQYILATAKYVDENGIKVVAKDVDYGFNGKAVVDPMPQDGTFSTPADVPANESLLGTEVEIVAFNAADNQLVTKTLTVVDSYTDRSLEFDPVQGPTNEDNKVTVSVVNEDGKVQQVNGKVSAFIADQSNEDAKVSVDTTKDTVNNGKATLTVYSDQETTADIVVIVKAGNEAYYGTLEYTFGAEDPLADRTVVMTIDSTEYVVNNNIITGDAAPYVDSAWRTMVPIRALAEAFDAEVIWNQDDSTVTINFDGDTQIVMTVGETTYTVNGEEATMDTEPVNTGSRVYVPIRFAAEGLGFSVTPLYNDAGLTASVVFQR